jgi:PAS domain S-box-containing protein
MASVRVLLLEDNPDDAEVIVLELERAGFDVAWQRAGSAQDFLDLLSPDLDMILADYALPQFNASQALTYLQATGYDIPFIVVSGQISEEVAVACMRQGATDYLLKDRLSRLGEAVRHALEERRLRQEKRAVERDLRIMNWAIESSINAVAIVGLDGEITYANEAFFQIWNFRDVQHVVGRSLVELWHIPDEASVVEQALRERQNIHGEMTAVSVDGTPIVLRYSISAVLDEDRAPICMMAMFIDLTEQKKAKEAEHEAELLRIQLEKEKELNDLKSRFTSMIIHDFRNPLATMRIHLDLLRAYPAHYDESKRQRKIAIVLEEIDQLNQLLEDVLAISKMEAGEAGFNPIQLDIEEYCRFVFSKLRESLGFRHTFVYNSHLDAVFMPFDPDLLQRALYNLVSNAVKYSPENTTITLELDTDDQNVILKVIDEGIGIPEADQKRLFDVFHRASNVGNIEGTGLGLTIVKHAVDLHQGRITFRSMVGKGTTFILTLPVEGRIS